MSSHSVSSISFIPSTSSLTTWASVMIFMCVLSAKAMPAPQQQPSQEQQQLTPEQQLEQQVPVHPSLSFPQLRPEFDYSRFYFGQNNFGWEKKSAPAMPPSYSTQQWYAGALPRQLAPKFKRDSSYNSHDKRLDDAALFDDFMANMKPGRMEWNFNRL